MSPQSNYFTQFHNTASIILHSTTTIIITSIAVTAGMVGASKKVRQLILGHFVFNGEGHRGRVISFYCTFILFHYIDKNDKNDKSVGEQN